MFPSTWEYISLKAYIILPALFYFTLLCQVCLYPTAMHASAYTLVHWAKAICGKILLIPIVQPFSHHLPSAPLPCLPLLYPYHIRLWGMQTEINIQQRCEWGLRNNDWHTDIGRERVTAGAWREGTENNRKCKMSVGSILLLLDRGAYGCRIHLCSQTAHSFICAFKGDLMCCHQISTEKLS